VFPKVRSYETNRRFVLKKNSGQRIFTPLGSRVPCIACSEVGEVLPLSVTHKPQAALERVLTTVVLQRCADCRPVLLWKVRAQDFSLGPRPRGRQRGGFLGRDSKPPPHQLGGLEERCELPSGVRGGAPTAQRFPPFSALSMTYPDTVIL